MLNDIAFYIFMIKMRFFSATFSPRFFSLALTEKNTKGGRHFIK